MVVQCGFCGACVVLLLFLAENLKRQNAYIPGIRPGTETAEALDMVVTRLTLAGAVYMNLVVLVPAIVGKNMSDAVNFGGTSLLIVVGVALESVRQVSAQMASQKYDALLFSDATAGSSSTGRDPGGKL
jgi:preprotein translocase subunit SecY